MKKLLTVITLLFMVSFKLFGQGYSELWKQVNEAEKKDLPKTQIDVLKKIVKKAKVEKSYGNLLAAELLTSNLYIQILPERVETEKARLQELCNEAEKTDKVLCAVYNCALGKLFRGYKENEEDVKTYFDKAVANPALLAKHQYTEYLPLIEKGNDDVIFNNDLLHVIALESGQYKKADAYYSSVGNREGACVFALKSIEQAKNMKALDSLIVRYGDLSVCGSVAIQKYKNLSSANDFSDVKQRVEYIDNALRRWGTWKEMNYLRNERERLTAPMFSIYKKKAVGYPNKPHNITDIKTRAINDLTLSITRTTLTGGDNLDPKSERDLSKIRQNLVLSSTQTINRRYNGYEPYEIITDSLQLPALEAGVYLIEVSSSNKTIKPQYQLYYVTNLMLLTEEQPNNKLRYVVVNALTGQPVPDAKIRLTFKGYYRKPIKTELLTTNKSGEAVYTYKEDIPDEIYVFTEADKACPSSSIWTNYTCDEESPISNEYQIFTDRTIYRPGQIVHTSVIAYTKDNKKQISKAKANKHITLKLRDANYEEIAKKVVVTDEFGTAATDFELPKGGLTGLFSIFVETEDASVEERFSVEEYKRPTFMVELDEYKGKYAVGDTIKLKGHAKTYSGMPVQGAHVSYCVNRREAWWWRSYNHNSFIHKDVAVTDEKGDFEVVVPLVISDNKEEKGRGNKKHIEQFFSFNVEANITDVAGETRTATRSIPLGTKSTLLMSNMPEKLLQDSLHQIKFSYMNIVGQSIEGKVRYTIAPYKEENQDFDHYTIVEANKNIDLKPLKSGHYQLYAICGTDTLKKDFIVFSMNDKRPVMQTHDWFYISGKKFPNNKKPVYVQFGSTDENQHVIYSVFSGNKVIESGSINQSNSNTTWELTYKQEYGDGIVLNLAWVKNGEVYKHSESIERPQPDKHLNVKWITFRNHLLPGEKEEWTLRITNPDGKPAKAQIMATLYDKSLDQIKRHSWNFSAFYNNNLPWNVEWKKLQIHSFLLEDIAKYKSLKQTLTYFARFNPAYVNHFGIQNFVLEQTASRSSGINLFSQMEAKSVSFGYKRKVAGIETKSTMNFSDSSIKENSNNNETTPDSTNIIDLTTEKERGGSNVQIRENLKETAFFYPRLNTDSHGNVSLKFTLPESLTTWRFMGLAHDANINYGMITDEVVAKKTVMVQPNMPRFVRMGDEAILSARIYNSSDQNVQGRATLEILDAETEKVLYTENKDYALEANGTTSTTFSLASLLSGESKKQLSIENQTVLIVRIIASGKDYSDGEQQYLVVLPNSEYVVNTYPFTQNKAGVKQIDLTKLFPDNTTEQRLTIEYTNNPNWLMIQALPYVANTDEQNAISLVSAYYANSLANKILKTSPKIRQVIESWRNEQGNETSMISALEKNQDLKGLSLKETPWVMEAKNESEQKQMLVSFFDDNQIAYNLSSAIKKLGDLQKPDGSFSWWKGMHGNFYMTVEVVKTLTRLNVLMGRDDEKTRDMIRFAFQFLDKEVAERVAEMKRRERKGDKNIFPSDALCDYLYSNALAKRTTTSDITYLINLLSKKPVDLTIYGKANTAVILQQYKQTQKAKDYLQSIKEYMVYKEEMGRYFDTKKAYYSWFDYKIPTQVAVIEAFKNIIPTDKQMIQDLQRWLLQSKRTQAWSTPVNSVNAIWAFMNNGQWTMDNGEASILKIDGKIIEQSKAALGMGYVKTTQSIAVNSQKNTEKGKAVNTLSVEKTSDGISWGAVYAQFFQPVAEIKSNNSGLIVKRELFLKKSDGKSQNIIQGRVGDKVVVRITIIADRDYDFVQLSDKRPACLEPVSQTSGYEGSYYISTKDYSTNYYFDMMRKGTHVVETEYFIDREGTYQSGTCTAKCAYAPEYSGREKAIKIKVNNDNVSN